VGVVVLAVAGVVADVADAEDAAALDVLLELLLLPQPAITAASATGASIA
jgi:hypothetical protein